MYIKKILKLLICKKKDDNIIVSNQMNIKFDTILKRDGINK